MKNILIKACIISLFILFLVPFVHADTSEQQWLEYEASYLEGKIKFMDNLDVFNDASVLGNYQKQLKYISALYQCNKMGYSVGDILDHIKIMAASNGIIRTHPCIRDYVVKSKSSGVHLDYLLEYLKDNPTFSYLKERSEGSAKDHEEVFVNKALELEQEGRYTETGDIYGRMITYILGTDNNFRTQVGWGIMNTNDNDRNLMRTLYSCTKDWDVENPFSEIWEKTNNRKEYNAGIPCVDQNTQGTGRVIVYKTLAVAIRSDTFISLVKMSRNKDGNLYTDDILYTLKRYGLIREQVDKLEDRNANSNFVSYEMYNTLATPSDDYIEIKTPDIRNNPSANALHRIAALKQKIDFLAQIKPKTITYAQISAVKEGVKGCAAGFVGGFTTWEGAGTNIGFFVAGGLTTVLSGGTSLVAGGLVLASGSYLMYEGFKDISTQWDQLDLEGKSEAACSLVMPLVMQGAGTKVFHSAAGKAKSYTKSKSSVTGKESIWTKDLVSTEKIKTIIAKARKGKPVTEPATFVVEQTPLKSFIEELKSRYAGKLKENDPRLKMIDSIGKKIRYDDLSADGQGMFKEFSEIFLNKDNIQDAVKNIFSYRINKLFSLRITDKIKYKLWNDIGGEIAIRLSGIDIPKSMEKRLFVTGKGLAGPDSEIIKSIIDPNIELTGTYENNILIRIAGSERFLEIVKRSDINKVDAIFERKEIEFIKELTDHVVSGDGSRYLHGQKQTAFLNELSGSELPRAMREAMINLGEHLKKDIDIGSLDKIDFEFIAKGAFKTAYKATIEVGGKKVDFVVKIGTISAEELSIYAELSKKGLTQKPFVKELAQIYKVDELKPEVKDPRQQIIIEEYVPGETISEAFNQKHLTLDEMGNIAGELNAKLFLRTADNSKGGGIKSLTNTDLNRGNIKIYRTESGELVEKIIDFDPTFKKELSVNEYTLYSGVSSKTGLGIDLNTFYFDGFVSGLTKEFQRVGLKEQSGIKLGASMLKRAADKTTFEQPITEYLSQKGYEQYSSLSMEQINALIEEYMAVVKY